jgi:two-component system alkaline phosphatase synthesis response regulator PhoP
MTENIKILLVDDEPDIIEFIGYNLEKEGFEVLKAANGREGISIARKVRPQVIILDVMMPEMDGIETCEELRKIPELENTMIAFLTARGEDYSQIAGFEAGADDYIAKPIRPKVLISRVKALIKRSQPMRSARQDAENVVVELDGLTIDPGRYIVVQNHKEFSLPKKEFELLSLLVSRPERVFTRDEIYRSVWGDEVIVGDRTIDVHIRKLREKLGEHLIKTIKGVGYKFTKGSNEIDQSKD